MEATNFKLQEVNPELTKFHTGDILKDALDSSSRRFLVFDVRERKQTPFNTAIVYDLLTDKDEYFTGLKSIVEAEGRFIKVNK
jgi:hypothetical protein